MENMPAVIFAAIVGTAIWPSPAFLEGNYQGMYSFGKEYLQNISS